MNELLPVNATNFEINLAEARSKEVEAEHRLNVMANSELIPEQFLNFLAIQNSVDYWRDQWVPSLKRSVIQNAFKAHKMKGTPAAIKSALAPFGYNVTLVEWWETVPEGKPGTFYLEVEVIGQGLSEEVNKEVNRLVSENKPASRHLSNLQFTSNPILGLRAAIGMQDAMIIEILPRS